jgi:hypothetical protein
MLCLAALRASISVAGRTPLSFSDCAPRSGLRYEASEMPNISVSFEDRYATQECIWGWIKSQPDFNATSSYFQPSERELNGRVIFVGVPESALSSLSRRQIQFHIE